MYLKRYIHEEGQFRAMVVDATLLGRKAFQELKPTPIGLQLATQALTGAVLLAATIKDEGTLQFQWRGDGPLGQLIAEANTAGDVRAMLGAAVDFEREPGKGMFEQAIGSGVLKVRRRTMPTQKIFESIVPLAEAELSQSFARYLLESQQVHAGILLGAKLHPELGVAGAGGVLIEALPSANSDLMFILEERLAEIASLGELFAAAGGHEQVFEFLFSDLKVKLLAETGVRYHCPCDRATILTAMASLPLHDLQEMLAENRTFHLDCSFCSRSYPCSPEDLAVFVDLKQQREQGSAS